jgi:hypothetical protein
MSIEWMCKDNWWVEYIEQELDPTEKREAEWYLQHSPLDRMIVENLISTKEVLKAADHGANWPSEAWGEMMESRIMTALKSEQIECPLRAKAEHRKMKDYSMKC